MVFLSNFYYDLYNWIYEYKFDEKEYPFFRRNWGLYYNLYSWCRYVGVGEKELVDELHISFIEAGLAENYPFNKSLQAFFIEKDHGKCYSNPERLKWIKKHY